LILSNPLGVRRAHVGVARSTARETGR